MESGRRGSLGLFAVVFCAGLAGCSDDPCADADGVTIHSQGDWNDFAGANCTSLAGKLLIEGSDVVDLQPAADKLVSIGGALTINGNAKLAKLSFANLERVRAHFEVFDNRVLSSLSAPKLSEGIGSMRIYGNPQLPQCQVDQLSKQQSTTKIVLFYGNTGACP